MNTLDDLSDVRDWFQRETDLELRDLDIEALERGGQRRRRIRIATKTVGSTAAVLVVLSAVFAVGAALQTERPTTPAVSAPATLNITASAGMPVMASTVRAGTYYVQVHTAGPVNSLQVVLPTKGLTPAAYNALYRKWYYDESHGAAAAQPADFHRWLTSATRIGGAITVTRTYEGKARTGDGIGRFAVTLLAGRSYWFYSSPSHIKVVNVIGTNTTPPTIPTVGLLQFGNYPNQVSVQAPSIWPSHGYIRAQGTPGRISLLQVQQILPGITVEELRNNCGGDGSPATMNCWVPNTGYTLGEVSAGATSHLVLRTTTRAIRNRGRRL